MRIEWLNAERTRARLTRGLFRKETADVHYAGYKWVFANGQDCDAMLSCDLRDQMESIRPSPWSSVDSDGGYCPAKVKLPKARVVK